MKALLLAPAVLSLLVLAAHFLRSGRPLLVLALLALPFLLLLCRPWVARTVQVVLVLGALEWSRTLWILAGRRIEAGEPALRLMAILGGVIAVSLAAALAFENRKIAAHYGLEGPPPAASGSSEDR